jgi:hypothetical protein
MRVGEGFIWDGMRRCCGDARFWLVKMVGGAALTHPTESK